MQNFTIPPEKSEAVARALREAFGSEDLEDVRAMTKGQSSALVLRVVVAGKPFLLRVIMRAMTLGPARHFACMQAAAGAGLAPRVLYTSIEDGISLTDFVEETPLPAAEALVRMPALLRTLHALPPFPGVESHLNTTCMFLMNEGAAAEGFMQRFCAAGILAPGEADELCAWRKELAAAHPRRDADMAPSHNDLFKPDNVLFDGRRAWLVDWEAAFQNDRYVDLAVAANLLALSEEEEIVYLREYFGQPPSPYQAARLFLMRQAAHLFYATVYLSLGLAGKPLNRDDAGPEYGAFQRSLRAGEVSLSDSAAKTAYGRVNWEELVRNMRGSRYAEALQIVS